MKTALKISILLNAALLGGLVFMAAGRWKMVSAPMPTTVADTKPQAAEVVPAAQPSPSNVEPEPFRWSQLESADYRAYVKNLRGIGCPEPTIRAIVAADVHNLYNAKYEQLDQKLTALNSAPLSTRLASYKEQQALEAELQKLPGEEASTAAGLQAQEPPPAATQVAARTSLGNPLNKAPVLPLVFQNVDLAQLNLNDQQIQAITDLRKQFVDQIGGPNQNPNDPNYLQQWQLTQPESDDILKGYLGIDKFMQYQIMAANGEVMVVNQ
jgi:hypothetical protein